MIKVFLVLCKAAWADPWVILVHESAHATLRSIRMTLVPWVKIQFTIISGRRDGFSTSNSALVSILGREKYLQVSRLTTHARTVSPSERCFFVLLLLVTLIYAIGILTALVLLCFHMWFLKHWSSGSQKTLESMHLSLLLLKSASLFVDNYYKYKKQMQKNNQ